VREKQNYSKEGWKYSHRAGEHDEMKKEENEAGRHA
jgi:hypothetical protein